MQDKCSAARVREIVHEEEMKGENDESSDNVGQGIGKKTTEAVEIVLTEINERNALGRTIYM